MEPPTPRRPIPPQGAKPVRRPVVASHAPPLRVKKRWDTLEICLWLAILAAGGGFAYYRLHPHPVAQVEQSAVAEKPAAENPPVAAPIPAATPAPAPAIAVAPEMPSKETAPREEPARPSPAATRPPVAVDSAQPLVLDETAGKKPENLARSQAALDTALSTGKWNDYVELLDRALATELKKSFGFRAPADYDRFLANPLFANALVQRTTLRRLSSAALAGLTSDTAHHEFAQWLLTTPEAMQSLLLAIKPDDDDAEALRVWAGLASEDPEARTKYRELAVACALVFDKPFTPQWNGERLQIPAGLRYDYYKQHNEKGDLATRIHRMAAADLVWVVCAPVPISEMEWTLKKLRLRQKNWGSAYEMVKYDMEKAVTGKMKKPYESYTFAEILDKGGICGDRAYFAANTARSAGIPAVVIGGDGQRGPHAWIGYQSDEGEWSFNGRMAGYSAGHGSDAQTGKGVSEQEFVRRGDKRESSSTVLAKAHRFLWLAALHTTLKDPAATDTALSFALQTSPHLPAAWDAKIDLWRTVRKDAPVEQWRDLVTDFKRAFADDAEQLATAKTIEENYVFNRQDAKLSLQQLKRDTKKIEEPRGRDAGKPGDAGFLTESLRRESALLRKAGTPDAIHSLYRRALEDHAKDVAVFKALANDYFAAFPAAPEDQRKAVRQIETQFERRVDTKGGGDFFDVTSANSVRALLVRMFRDIGDEKHALALEKKSEKVGEKAKRTAL